MGYSKSSPSSPDTLPCVKKALVSIIRSEGTGVLDNPKRVRALLSDHCLGKNKREILLLERLLIEGVPADLLRQKDSVPYRILSANITRNILADHPLDAALVGWGTDTLAEALGISKKDPEESSPVAISPGSPPLPVPPVVRPAGVPGENPKKPTMARYVLKGIQLNRRKLFPKALALLNKALKAEPENSIALREKGFALSGLGRYKEAIPAFDRALNANSRDPMTWTYKGYTLARLRQWTESVTAYGRAIEIDPGNAVAWRNKGYALGMLGSRDEAAECLKESLAISEDPVTWNLMGGVLEGSSEKLNAFEMALTLDPGYLPAILNKAGIFAKEERYQEALLLYEQVLARDTTIRNARTGRDFCLRKIQGEKQKHRNSPGHSSLRTKDPVPGQCRPPKK
ncbi:MAG: tetratricopeptide repeat protein [Methanoregulaceae archaeon]